MINPFLYKLIDLEFLQKKGSFSPFELYSSENSLRINFAELLKVLRLFFPSIYCKKKGNTLLKYVSFNPSLIFPSSFSPINYSLWQKDLTCFQTADWMKTVVLTLTGFVVELQAFAGLPEPDDSHFC